MNTSVERRNRLIGMIDEALIGVRREIEKVKSGAQALDGLEQLLFIESKLSEMKQILGREDWQSYPRSKPGIARMVVDTWPMRDPRGNLLSQIEYEYHRLCSKS